MLHVLPLLAVATVLNKQHPVTVDPVNIAMRHYGTMREYQAVVDVVLHRKAVKELVDPDLFLQDYIIGKLGFIHQMERLSPLPQIESVTHSLESQNHMSKLQAYTMRCGELHAIHAISTVLKKRQAITANPEELSPQEVHEALHSGVDTRLGTEFERLLRGLQIVKTTRDHFVMASPPTRGTSKISIQVQHSTVNGALADVAKALADEIDRLWKDLYAKYLQGQQARQEEATASEQEAWVYVMQEVKKIVEEQTLVALKASDDDSSNVSPAKPKHRVRPSRKGPATAPVKHVKHPRPDTTLTQMTSEGNHDSKRQDVPTAYLELEARTSLRYTVKGGGSGHEQVMCEVAGNELVDDEHIDTAVCNNEATLVTGKLAYNQHGIDNAIQYSMSLGVRWNDFPCVPDTVICSGEFYLPYAPWDNGAYYAERRAESLHFFHESHEQGILHSMAWTGEERTNGQVATGLKQAIRKFFLQTVHYGARGLLPQSYFHMGKIFHMVMDSYACGHTVRAGDDLRIIQFMDFAAQRGALHVTADYYASMAEDGVRVGNSPIDRMYPILRELYVSIRAAVVPDEAVVGDLAYADIPDVDDISLVANWNNQQNVLDIINQIYTFKTDAARDHQEGSTIGAYSILGTELDQFVIDQLLPGTSTACGELYHEEEQSTTADDI